MKRTEDGFMDISIRRLIKWNEPNGDGCLVSDKITKEGWKVGYMYREEPDEGRPDSGWRFFKGDEEEEYLNDPKNCHVFSLNTVCNYDPDIVQYLHSEVGCRYIRVNSKKFEIDDGTKPIFFEMQRRYPNLFDMERGYTKNGQSNKKTEDK